MTSVVVVDATVARALVEPVRAQIQSDEALHLDQGIAVTSDASQGKTVDQVIVSVPVSAFSQANEAQFYVSMSRARTAMHLFTDSKAALKEAVMRPRARVVEHSDQLLMGHV
jgi:hypothetical protein